MRERGLDVVTQLFFVGYSVTPLKSISACVSI
jgi:hypothetical protein